VYARKVQGKELTFQVSGKLWQRSLVMRDLETETLWSHLLGRGMQGELEDVELETFPAAMTTWGEWKERHPKTTLLAMPRTVREYDEGQWEDPDRFVFGILLGFGKPAPAVGLKRLQQKEIVMVLAGEINLVVTFLEEGGSVQAFYTMMDNQSLTFHSEGDRKMKDEETGSEWDRISGEAVSGSMKGKKLKPVSGTISFRKAWEAFYPDDKILK